MKQIYYNSLGHLNEVIKEQTHTYVQKYVNTSLFYMLGIAELIAVGSFLTNVGLIILCLWLVIGDTNLTHISYLIAVIAVFPIIWQYFNCIITETEKYRDEIEEPSDE